MISSTRHQVLTIGRATMLDRALQFVVPIALVRLLDVGEFGEYRLFWLVVGSIMTVATLGMPRGLLYFLPRADAAEKPTYVANTLFFLAFTGVVCGLLVSPWNGIVHSLLSGAQAASYVLPLFVVLWVVASLLDLLPNANQHFRWQANVVIGLSISRLCVVIGTAYLTRDINFVLLALLVFVVLKLLVLAFYLALHFGKRIATYNRPTLVAQLRYAVPFGISGGLYNLWAYAEQWVVASLFRPGQFAVFAVSGYLLPLVEVVRGSISNVLLPKMSALHAGGDFKGMLALNNKGNLTAALILFPALAFVFAFADKLTILLFTKSYAEAAAIMQIYLIGLARLAIEISTVLAVLSQGAFMMRLSALLLLLCILCSYTGALIFGLPGAALGTVVVLYVETLFTYRRAGRLIGTPVRRLQDWASLAKLLGAAVGAAALAVLGAQSATANVYLQLGVATVIMVSAYALAVVLSGCGWILTLVLGRPGAPRTS